MKERIDPRMPKTRWVPRAKSKAKRLKPAAMGWRIRAKVRPGRKKKMEPVSTRKQWEGANSREVADPHFWRAAKSFMRRGESKNVPRTTAAAASAVPNVLESMRVGSLQENEGAGRDLGQRQAQRHPASKKGKTHYPSLALVQVFATQRPQFPILRCSPPLTASRK